MNDLIILPSDKTPGVDFSTGILTLRGCSIVSDPKAFFDPLHAWTKKYIKNPPEITSVNIQLDYIDTPSTHALFSILTLLKKLEEKDLAVLVNWYYEYGDLEMLELGEVIQGRLEMEFTYIEHEIKHK